MLLRTLPRRLTYANVASSVCLFIVLGGSAYAATSITGKDVKNGSLTGADVKDHSLRAKDFKPGELPRGPAGAAGAAGAAGRDGAPGVVQAPARARQPAGRLTIPGVTGDATGGAIEVRSVSWSNALSGDPFVAGGGATAKPVWGEVVVAKAPDRSSPQLWKLAATGQHVATAKLELLAPGGTPYATYTLKDVRATGFSTRGSGDEREDEVRLTFVPNPALAFDPSAPLPAPAAPRVGRMTVDGVPGDIDLVLDAWSLANPEKAQSGPFVVSKAVDGSSPALLSRFASGAHIKAVTVQLLQPGSETVYTTYVLTDVVVSSFAVLGDERPLERLGLAAAKLASTTPVAGGEEIHSCFDFVLNDSCAA
jgi:type VI protein secretion system component Hcp